MYKVLVPFLIGIISTRICAQPQDTIIIDRIETPIQLDGNIDELAWLKISPLPLVTYSPAFGNPGTERTEIRVAYDDQYLYFSGKMFVKDIKDMQGNSLIRDLDLEGDFFNVLLDSYNDNENMLGFFTTPTGQRLDAEVSNDAEGPNFWNQSWNAFWDTAVKRTSEGWFAEMRIPFSSLRFEDNNGDVVMGMIVQRRIGRKNERMIFPAIPPKWNFARNKPSKAQKILLRGVHSKKSIYLSPFLVSSRRKRDPESDKKETTFDQQAGLDAKFSLSSNLTLDATINTDFAQVEADLTQVNLTRFSLFFPEKRQFFQERAGIFAFETGGNTRLFHSRRIGLTDNGDPIKIIGGARLIGRIRNTDIGLLSMQTANDGIFPTENFGILRLRNRVLNKYSYVGSMFTTRIDGDGNSNLNYGVDGILRIVGSDYLSFKWAHTLSDSFTPATSFSVLDETLINVNWENRSLDGFGYKTEYSRVGQSYNPAVGFIFRNNISVFDQTLRYGKLLQNHNLILRHTPYASGNTVFLNDRKELWEWSLAAGWRIDFLSRAALTLEYAHQLNRLFEDFHFLERVIIPVGEYSYDRGRLSYVTSLGRRFRSTVDFETGTFFNGYRTSVKINPAWNVSKHLSFGMRLEVNKVNFNENESIKANIVSVNLTSAFDIHFSVASFVQYNSLEDRMATNIRLRYNFREGHDAFLVYNNQTFYSDSDTETLIENSNSITLKYIYTFVR